MSRLRFSLAWGTAWAVCAVGIAIAFRTVNLAFSVVAILLALFFAVGLGLGGYFSFSSRSISVRSRRNCAIACAVIGATVVLTNLVLVERLNTQWAVSPTSADPAIHVPTQETGSIVKSSPAWRYATRSVPVSGVAIGLALWLCLKKPGLRIRLVEVLGAVAAAALWAGGFLFGGLLFRPLDYLSRGLTIDVFEANGITPWLGSVVGTLLTGFVCGVFAGAIVSLAPRSFWRIQDLTARDTSADPE